MPGDDLNSARIHDPNGAKVFEDMAKGPLHEQKLTETFAESAEPLCWNDPEADPDTLVVDDVLPNHPKDVEVDSWEVVLEPDVEDSDPLGNLKFTIRVAGDIAPKVVTVPVEYLALFADNTPAKIEVGAIGGDDNATFTEIPICLNEVDDGCEGED